MVAAAAPKLVTPEEYLALERRAEIRHEYWEGEIRAMAGASRRHNLVGGNAFGEIRFQLKGRDCEVYQSEMRVQASARKYFYPDVVAVCGEVRLADEHFDTLLNPTVIVETLSPSTEADDLGAKGAAYRQMPSLQEYVLIAQNRVYIKHYLRQDAHWTETEITDIAAVLHLPSIACAVALRDIYDKVSLPQSEDRDNIQSA